ncbi:MAG: hypothetical protein MUE96_00255 [Bacteroidia bacterium]|jgi:hypothetical protein|nr:hypothetical protein [Bacteroidia bacterium]
MLKDIVDQPSEGITLAAVYELSAEKEMVWNVYLLNYKEESIEGVLVVSKGYGEPDENTVETSVLRHFVNEIPAQSFARIEPLQEDLFALNNEYFVTYYLGSTLFEKKFVFAPYTISAKNTQHITFIGQQGIELL